MKNPHLKAEAHKALDQFWSTAEERTDVYRWLNSQFGDRRGAEEGRKGRAHIRFLNEEGCKRVIALCKEVQKGRTNVLQHIRDETNAFLASIRLPSDIHTNYDKYFISALELETDAAEEAEMRVMDTAWQEAFIRALLLDAKEAALSGSQLPKEKEARLSVAMTLAFKEVRREISGLKLEGQYDLFLAEPSFLTALINSYIGVSVPVKAGKKEAEEQIKPLAKEEKQEGKAKKHKPKKAAKPGEEKLLEREARSRLKEHQIAVNKEIREEETPAKKSMELSMQLPSEQERAKRELEKKQIEARVKYWQLLQDKTVAELKETESQLFSAPLSEEVKMKQGVLKKLITLRESQAEIQVSKKQKEQAEQHLEQFIECYRPVFKDYVLAYGGEGYLFSPPKLDEQGRIYIPYPKEAVQKAKELVLQHFGTMHSIREHADMLALSWKSLLSTMRIPNPEVIVGQGYDIRWVITKEAEEVIKTLNPSSLDQCIKENAGQNQPNSAKGFADKAHRKGGMIVTFNTIEEARAFLESRKKVLSQNLTYTDGRTPGK